MLSILKRSGKDKQDIRQQALSDALRALIERALADAEQMVASIKMKAQKEAEEEAVRIIDQANQSADEIRKRAEAASLKQAEIQRAREQVEKKAKLATKEIPPEKKVEMPVQPEKELTVSEPPLARTKKVSERHPREERPDKKEEAVSAPQQLDTGTLYEGEVELAIAVPVDPAAVSRLYNGLQGTSEIKVRYTRGSWERGTIITLALDRPVPLIDIISKIPGIAIAPAVTQKGNNGVKIASDSLLTGRKKTAKRIDLIIKARP